MLGALAQLLGGELSDAFGQGGEPGILVETMKWLSSFQEPWKDRMIIVITAGRAMGRTTVVVPTVSGPSRTRWIIWPQVVGHNLRARAVTSAGGIDVPSPADSKPEQPSGDGHR